MGLVSVVGTSRSRHASVGRQDGVQGVEEPGGVTQVAAASPGDETSKCARAGRKVRPNLCIECREAAPAVPDGKLGDVCNESAFTGVPGGVRPAISSGPRKVSMSVVGAGVV